MRNCKSIFRGQIPSFLPCTVHDSIQSNSVRNAEPQHEVSYHFYLNALPSQMQWMQKQSRGRGNAMTAALIAAAQVKTAMDKGLRREFWCEFPEIGTLAWIQKTKRFMVLEKALAWEFLIQGQIGLLNLQLGKGLSNNGMRTDMRNRD